MSSSEVAQACCVEGFLWDGQPTGEQIFLGHLPAYHAKPPTDVTPGPETSAILFIHDAFGWEFPNLRLLCDRLAKVTGIHVYMPDFYKGKALVREEHAQELLDPKGSMLGKIGQDLKFVAHLPGFVFSFSKFGVKQTEPSVNEAVDEIKKRHGNDACKLGAVGFCWGGKYALRLGVQKKAVATVACHPLLVDPVHDELSTTIAACLFCRAEKDNAFTEKLWHQTEAAIQKAGVPLDSHLYPGTEHGFCVRCSPGDTKAMKCQMEASQRYAEWFIKYLK